MKEEGREGGRELACEERNALVRMTMSDDAQSPTGFITHPLRTTRSNWSYSLTRLHGIEQLQCMGGGGVRDVGALLKQRSFLCSKTPRVMVK